MTRGFVLAAGAGMVTIALVGGVLCGVIFAGLLRANIVDLSIMNSPPGIGWIALSHVPFGVLLTLVVRWRGELSAGGGAIAGALLGFLMAASYNLAQFGTIRHWTLQLTVVEPFITMSMIAAAGAVVGAVLARTQAGGSRTGRDQGLVRATNNSMQRAALRAAADAKRWAS